MSNRFITKRNPATSPPDFSTNFAAAAAVPPVAIKSSMIITFSYFKIESFYGDSCIYLSF